VSAFSDDSDDEIPNLRRRKFKANQAAAVLLILENFPSHAERQRERERERERGGGRGRSLMGFPSARTFAYRFISVNRVSLLGRVFSGPTCRLCDASLSRLLAADGVTKRTWRERRRRRDRRYGALIRRSTAKLDQSLLKVND